MKRIFSILILFGTGCSDSFDGPLMQATGPYAVGAALAYLDPATSSLVIVDPAGKAGPKRARKLWRAEAGEKPVAALSVPKPDGSGSNRVLVLDPVGAQVLLFDDEAGRAQSLSIGVPLEACDVAADGRWGIAYEPDGAVPSRSLFAFPNTVAVLDLGATPPTAQALRLGSSGSRPLKAVFAGSVTLTDVILVDGVPQNRSATVPLAFVFVRGGVVPIDLAKGIAGPVVPLTPDQSLDVLPAEVLFTNNESDAIRGTLDGVERAFVRSTAGELYVLALSLAHELGDEGGMDIIVSLENVVTPDAAVTDVELFFDDDGSELLLAAAGDELILVNGYTGVSSRFAIDITVDTLVRFVDPESNDARALGYGKASPDYRLLRLNPLALERRRSNGIELLRLGSPVADVAITGASSRAVLEYEDGRDLGVLDLVEAGEVLDLRFAERPSARSLSLSGDRLRLVSRSPEDDAPYLAEVDLGPDLFTRQVRLDRDAAQVGQAGRYLFVDHGDPSGAVTFFPDDDLSRKAAISFTGVLYTDLLNELPPDERTDNDAEADRGEEL